MLGNVNDEDAAMPTLSRGTVCILVTIACVLACVVSFLKMWHHMMNENQLSTEGIVMAIIFVISAATALIIWDIGDKGRTKVGQKT
jgi:hypothetical protein